jgi:glycosyltransferase involved in cell wall biosynthesis
MKKYRPCSVSVVIPFYNASSSISAALTSIFEQTLLPSEIIIVDDCSCEHELVLLKDIIDGFNGNLSNQVLINLLILSDNNGASYARNIAIKEAKEKYLAFLDADDVWAKNKVDLQYNFMESKDYFMVGHGYIFDLTNEKIVDEPLSYSKVNKYQFIYTNPFFTPTVMVLRESFKLFDESFRRVDDYKCWLENFDSGNIAIIHNKLAGGFKHPIGAGGLTGSLSKMHLAYMNVLKSLHEEQVISPVFYYLAKLVEFLKYPLRIIATKIKYDVR